MSVANISVTISYKFRITLELMCKTLNLHFFKSAVVVVGFFLIQTFVSINRPYPHYSNFYELHHLR